MPAYSLLSHTNTPAHKHMIHILFLVWPKHRVMDKTHQRQCERSVQKCLYLAKHATVKYATTFSSQWQWKLLQNEPSLKWKFCSGAEPLHASCSQPRPRVARFFGTRPKKKPSPRRLSHPARAGGRAAIITSRCPSHPAFEAPSSPAPSGSGVSRRSWPQDQRPWQRSCLIIFRQRMEKSHSKRRELRFCGVVSVLIDLKYRGVFARGWREGVFGISVEALRSWPCVCQ